MRAETIEFAGAAAGGRGLKPMAGDLIRVLLVDDHAVVRAGLRAVLGEAKDIDVVGEARNGREAIA